MEIEFFKARKLSVLNPIAGALFERPYLFHFAPLGVALN
jgi:hypothetical protein